MVVTDKASGGALPCGLQGGIDTEEAIGGATTPEIGEIESAPQCRDAGSLPEATEQAAYRTNQVKRRKLRPTILKIYLRHLGLDRATG
jgi:hypothetical protein